MATSQLNPKAITGGCLCQSIKYEVTFSEESQWPPSSSTCQCTMCRKWTASLLPHFLTVSADQIVPPLSSFPSYREYGSSPGRYRGFCENCGSPLIWRAEDQPKELDLFLGTLDERWLVGERVPCSSSENTPSGVEFQREGGLGRILCTPLAGQFYYENVIPGVTDLVPGGPRMLTDRNGVILD